MKMWNEAVDKYIEVSGDPRPRLHIERAAKVGPHGGPLYRHCEAEDCERVEGRDVETLKCCGGANW